MTEIGKDAFIAPNIGQIPLEKLRWIVEGSEEEPIFKEWFVLTDQTGSKEFVKLVYLHSADPNGQNWSGISIHIIEESYQPETPCTNPPVSIVCVNFVLDDVGVETLPFEIASPALIALKALTQTFFDEYKEIILIAVLAVILVGAISIINR